MSGHWIKLHDTRVRVDAQASDLSDALHIARCLAQLYDVPSIIDLCDCEEWGTSSTLGEPCGCLWPSRNHGD